ncbi:hypothetical protein QQ008_15900 [Fulvivirgaceae bacterium BMA10]|uniref:ABC-2 family transporter protein n=1 Tax=Splendidivirga corallicola TaxID=3051826 RepID=A0ABT8KRP9_9BACT|nr:hypothetical protein [Fulvivirgaceae bacterium BMA10]
MTSTNNLINYGTLVLKLFQYNIKVIFANKFIYFLVAAVLFFVMLVTIALFDDPVMNEALIFGFLMFPGILLMFYPIAYGIQNDDDSKMLEIIFGIPNYRYKVWLLRFVMIILVVLFNLYLLCLLANFTILQFDIFPMLYRLLFPITFLASLGFMLSTLVKSGNGTAIVMVIVGLIFLIFIEPLEYSAWNIFLNPYGEPRDMNQTIWMQVVLKNRLYLTIGSIVTLLYAMFNLQSREKFVS